MSRISGARLSKLIIDAGAGKPVKEFYKRPWIAEKPRRYDQSADFEHLLGIGGVYVIFSAKKAGPSRILYIGKGDLNARLPAHLQKKGLRELSRLGDVSYTVIPLTVWSAIDLNLETVFEAILLNEHVTEFGALPRFNTAPGPKDYFAWRKVIRAAPGPIALLRRYGG